MYSVDSEFDGSPWINCQNRYCTRTSTVNVIKLLAEAATCFAAYLFSIETLFPGQLYSAIRAVGLSW